MSDKKLPKIKHNHTLTDILKASIFSLVMMAPITAIGVTCAYVVCNKNAYQSYSGTNQNTESIIVVDDIETLDYSKTYKLGNSYLNTSVSATSSAYIYFDSVNVIYELSNKTLANVDRMYIYANSNTMYYNFYAGTTNITYGSSENFLIEVKIRSFNGNETAINNLNTDLSNSSTLYYIEYFNEQQLDNVFYYAIDTMQNNSLFSWTKTTAIYTPVSAMTTGMGIITPAIAVLLVYWLLCTAVYIIIDIVVKGFTWLTHLIGER